MYFNSLPKKMPGKETVRRESEKERENERESERGEGEGERGDVPINIKEHHSSNFLLHFCYISKK